MARNVVDELVVRVTADATKLAASLGKAEGDAKKSGEKIGMSFATAFAGAAKLGAGAATAIGGVVTALTVAADKAADYADRIDKASQSTGFARGSFQELTFALDQNGIGFEQATMGLKDFNARLGQAASGNKSVADAYKRLGVAVRDSNGQVRDSESVFNDALAALSGLDSASAQAAEGALLFGEEFSRGIIPALNSGADGIDALRAKARELGIVLDDQSIGSLVRYKDEMAAFRESFGAASREITLQFLPVMTEGVLPAVENALRVFRAMPEPLQRGVAALTGFGTAATAAATGLRLLGVSSSFLFGPAGIAFAAVAALGTLVFALAGGRDSLTSAIEEANAALVGGDATSLTGALDEVIEKVDVDTRDSLQRLRDDLVATGAVGVEQANLIKAALEDAAKAPLRAERDLLASQIEQIESLLASERDVGAAVARRAAIEREFTPVLDAGGTIPFEITRELTQLDLIIGGAGISAAELARQEARLADARERLAELDKRLASAPTPRPTPTPPPPPGDPEDRRLNLLRTGEQVVDILRRQLALLDPLVADRLAAQQGGITRAGNASGLEKTSDAIVERILAQERLLDPLVAARLAAQQGGVPLPSTGTSPTGIITPPGSRANFPTGLAAQLILRDVQERQLAEQALIDSVREANRTRRQAEVIEAQKDAAARRELRERMTQLSDEGSGFAGVAGIGGPGAAAASAAGAGFQAGVVGVARDTLVSLIATGAPAGELSVALERLRSVSPDAARQFDFLALSLVDAATAAASAATAIPQRNPFADAAGPFAGVGRGADGDQRGRAAAERREELLQQFSRFGEDQQKAWREAAEAAEETKQAIVTAGVRFASDLAGAIKSGSPSGIFGALTGGIGSLVGVSDPFVGGLISIVGGLFAGLISDGEDESEAARAAGARPNGAPAIELNLSVFQNLAVNSLTGGDRAAVDGLLDQTVSRIESVLVSFGQRLTAVEARTA